MTKRWLHHFLTDWYTESIPVRMAVIVVFCTMVCQSCKQDKNIVPKQMSEKPNVLFIAVDDLNTYLGYLGDPNAVTPNFDRLASSGTVFTNAHCQAPLCGPSRASLLTGLRPSTTGIYGMIMDDSIKTQKPLLIENLLMPEYFQKQGYITYGVGKIFHHFAPKNGFVIEGGRFSGLVPSHNFGPKPKKRMAWEGYAEENPERYGKTSTDWGAFPDTDAEMPHFHNTEWAIEQLTNHKSEAPFFMAVGYLRPHVPLRVPQKWFDRYPLDSLELPPYLVNGFDDIPEIAKKEVAYLPMMPTTDWAIETGNWKKILQAYLACVSFVDNELGKLLTTLNNSPHAGNTIIVLWSDHGYRIGEKGSFAKQALWEEATLSPLIFNGLAIPMGGEIDTPVVLLSVYPTLLELCGLPPNEANEGMSLVPLLNREEKVKRSALTTYGYNNHSIRTEDFRYIRYEDGSEELYDMKNDSNQFHNLADSYEYRKVRESHRKLLPSLNAKWHANSNYTFQPYFVEQKVRINGEIENR